MRRKKFFGGVMDTFIILFVVMVSQEQTYLKTNFVVHLTYVQFVSCQLCLNQVVFLKIKQMKRQFRLFPKRLEVQEGARTKEPATAERAV